MALLWADVKGLGPQGVLGPQGGAGGHRRQQAAENLDRTAGQVLEHLEHRDVVPGSTPDAPTIFSIDYETKGSGFLPLFSFSGVKRGDKRPVLAAIRPHARTLEFPRRPRGTARRTPAAMYLTGDHDGLVTVAGPAVPRSARPGQGKRRLGTPPGGRGGFGGPSQAVPSPKD